MYNNSDDIAYKNCVGILHIFQTREMCLEKDRKKSKRKNTIIFRVIFRWIPELLEYCGISNEVCDKLSDLNWAVDAVVK